MTPPAIQPHSPSNVATARRAIETIDLSRRFGEQVAVDRVCLSLEQGEILGFIGPNGAGKSTFLKMLIGLTRPSSGAASVFGLDCEKDSVAIRRRVGYLPGDLGLYRNLRADRLLEFCLGFHETADPRKARRLAEHLSVPLDRKVKNFSTGMRQKLGIIQALCVGGDLLLLDEPTQGLDPTSRASFLELLREERSAGASIVVSSHILSEVEQLADRTVFLDQGKVVPNARIEAAREAFRQRLHVVFRDPLGPDMLEDLQGASVLEQDGRAALLRVDGDLGDVLARLARIGLDAIDYNRPNLEDMYRLLYLDPSARRRDLDPTEPDAGAPESQG